MEWEWSKYNREGLASFVTDKAVEFLRLSENRVDLTQSRGRRQLLEVIYNTLVEQKIRYAPEKYHPSAAKQRIRTPAEILKAPGEGTCLDLATLFCGLCLGNDLLPMLIVLEGHALVAVSLNHGLRKWNDDYSREKWELFSHRPFEDSEQLKRLIDDEAYLAIECTGFAYSKSLPESVPEGLGRTEERILPFERAVAAGREQLDQLERPLRFALDIAVAHYSWRIEPLEIPKPDVRYTSKIDEVTPPSSTANRNAEVISPPQPPPNLAAFEFEVVTVNAQGQEIKRCCKQAQYFIESLGGAVELEMVSIPSGKFQMGAPKEEEASQEDERPQHLVAVKPFFMGRYPITQAQWRAFASLPKIKRDLDCDPSCFKGDKRPVERVSWYEAMEFCERLSKKTGREYRLPSEAEWEYACRARTPTQFHFGKTATTNLANYCGEDQKINGILCQGTYSNEPYGVYRKQTIEVGSFPANAFGLYDMHGNVWEWCADYEHEDYQGAPSHGSAWLNDGNSEYRILRGGSWDSSPRFCRSASRFSQDASTIDKEFGFRVVGSFM
jgi:formylglycine-generating enzyme required for sulfatase activity